MWRPLVFCVSCHPLSAVRGPACWVGDPGLASGVRGFQFALVFCGVLPGGVVWGGCVGGRCWV